jgi:hypothetical protein
MGPIQVVVEDGNNLVLEVTPTPDTTVILDRGIAGPPGPAGDGDVDGPASSTDNAVARFDGTTGKVIQNSNVTIDDSGNLTYSAGTANGVAYLNGSKVLTTGSALTFDGTNFATTGNANLGSVSKSTDTQLNFAADTGTQRIYIERGSRSLVFSDASGGIENYRIAGITGIQSWGVGGSEQMRLTSTGLGIGTSSPGAKLDVEGTTQIRHKYTGAPERFSIGQFNSSGDASINNIANAPLLFATNNTEQMRLDASGNLGIGTSAPDQKLTVYTSTANQGVSVYNTIGSGGYGGGITFGIQAGLSLAQQGKIFTSMTNGGPGTVAADMVFQQAIGGSLTEFMRASSGNLGIGTSSPTAKLTVSGLAGNGNGLMSVDGSDFVRMYADATFGSTINWSSGDALRFATSNSTFGGFTELARLDSSGNLGLGVTPVSSQGRSFQFGVAGALEHESINTNDLRTNLASNALSITPYSNSYKYLSTGGSATMLQQVTGQFKFFTASTGTAGDAISFSQVMTLDSSGNLGIGTSSPAWKLDVQTTQSRFQVRDGANTGGTSAGTGLVSVNTTATALDSFNYRATTHAFIVDSSEAMRLTSTGLGIGTSSPQGQLSLGSAAGGQLGLTLDWTGAGGPYQVASFTANRATGEVRIGATNAGGDFFNTFYTNNTERMRLDSSGNLGLGVTPSAWSSYKVIDIVTGGLALAGGTESGAIAVNAYFNGGWKYKTTGTYKTTRYDQFDGAHYWFTAPSGTAGNAISFSQVMTLDASGDLLLGTTSGGYRLNVYDTATSVVNIESSQTESYIRFTDASTNSDANAPRIGTIGDGNFAIRTGGSERARIDSSGNLLVGTTSNLGLGTTIQPSGFVHIRRDGGSTATFRRDTNTGTLATFQFDGSDVGSISTNGTTTSYNVTSDQRLKENIQDAAPASALIDAIQVRQYNWKSDGSHQRYGFIAQELVTVAPEAVHQPADPEEMMAVDYSKLVPMLVKEIQSLRARVAALESI